MKDTVRVALLYVSLFVLVIIMSSASAFADEVATAYSVQGSVETQAAGGTDWVAVSRGASFSTGDKIRTGASSRAGLRFVGGRLVRLRENSLLTIEAPQGSDTSGGLRLFSGAAHLFSHKAKEFPTVKTTEVSAAIRGTEFVIAAANGTTTVTVLDGEVQLENAAGMLRLTGGERGVTAGQSAPQKKLIVDPTDAVQWALHFPLIIDPEDFADVYASTPLHNDWKHLVGGDLESAGNGFQGQSLEDRLGRSLLAAMMHDATAALAQLGTVPDASPDVIQVYRGNLLLATGRHEEVKDIHKRLAASSSLSGSAKAALLSQKAVLLLLAGEKDRALQESEMATEAAPDSRVAAIVRSYVHQGRRELGEALKWAEKASEGEYPHPHALARQAELLLGMGEVTRAVDIAKEAGLGAGNDPYVLSVLGYTHLTHYDTEKAKDAFERAIKVDASRGLAFFGNGLAHIRSGELERGRQELEEAVHLEPTNALYRSYLGKAYFEENKEEIAGKEYSRAIALDESDPTPYLYQAFNHLSQNKPVEALKSVEDSIALNDNRAVYRSDFLLDQDLAVRGTTLSEVFNQLGFSRIAQLEAINSINHDYSNYSAHRLYAESLNTDFLSDAQRSESIISDIMAPLSFNVFSNLDGFSSDASFNEYAAMFDRPIHRTGVSAGWDTKKDHYTAQGTQTGVIGNFGYFLGALSEYGMGRKSTGSYARRHRFDLNTQYQLDYSNRFIFGSSFEKRDNKFVVPFEEDPDDPFVEMDDFEQVELSLSSNHRFGPHARLLSRLEYTDRDRTAFSTDELQLFSQSVSLDGMSISELDGVLTVDEGSKEEVETLRYSLQQLADFGRVSAVLGGEVFSANANAAEESTLIDVTGVTVPAFRDVVSSSADTDTDSYGVYGYTKWNALDWLTFDAGLNYSEIQLTGYDVIAPYVDGVRTARGWSPKAGFSLKPVENLTVRGAYIERLASSNIDDIGSIEPTLVGSFSQAFGDLPGSDAESYGLGVDYKLPSQTYLGAEYVIREVSRDDVAVIRNFETNLDDLTDSESLSISILNDEVDEDLLRAYLYQVIGKSSALAIDYRREQRESDTESLLLDSDTDRAKVSLRSFCTSRWFTFGDIEWYHQKASATGVEKFSESVWLLDLGVGYRLPLRGGLIRASFENILGQNFEIFDNSGRNSDLVSGFHFNLQTSFNF